MSTSHEAEGKKAVQLIVLTGGPGAGKTAVLEFARRVLPPVVAVLPEAASILFGGGFWRIDSVNARRAGQLAIFHVQRQLENLVCGEGQWHTGLCDRGTLDGLAYWPDSEVGFFSEVQTTLPAEFARYRAVIHLHSPTRDQGYNLQNPVRTETPEVAAVIDARIANIWKHHPNYHAIPSTDNFIEKLNLAIRRIQSYLPESQNE